MKKQVKTSTVEVRNSVNDNVVLAFDVEVTEHHDTNIIAEGYRRIANVLGINTFDARLNYYVTKS